MSIEWQLKIIIERQLKIGNKGFFVKDERRVYQQGKIPERNSV